MSTVRVSHVKLYLRVTHRGDDFMLQQLINGAESEVLSYLDREQLPRAGEFVVNECDSNSPPIVSDSDDLAHDVRMAIYLIVQGLYEGKSPEEMAAVREVALNKCHPYRNRLGV